MKRGLVFSILMILLLGLLFTLALFQIRPSSSITMMKKLVYTWDDVREDLFNLTSLRVEQYYENLSVFDSVPPAKSVSAALGAYMNFINKYYKETNLEIVLLDSGGNPITNFDCFAKADCSEEEVSYSIIPFNISYGYPDWSKKEIDITCRPDSSPPCDFSPTQRLVLEFNLTTITFSCDPARWGNCTSSDIQWGQFSKVFGTGVCGPGEKCLLIPYNFTVRDSVGRVYSCPGVFGPDSGNTKDVNCNATVFNWYDSSKATLVIKSSPCWVRSSFGDGGQFMLSGSQPNGNDPCNFAMLTLVKFQFNTSDYYFNVPSMLRVRDVTSNSSVTRKI